MEAAVANLLPKHTFWEDGNTALHRFPALFSLRATFSISPSRNAAGFV